MAGGSNARDARAQRRPDYLAKQDPCRYCGRPIVLAICRDGRWRTFDPDLVPAMPAGIWAWRKRYGMEETDRTSGYVIHKCADFHDRAFRFAGNLVTGEPA